MFLIYILGANIHILKVRNLHSTLKEKENITHPWWKQIGSQNW